MTLYSLRQKIQERITMSYSCNDSECNDYLSLCMLKEDIDKEIAAVESRLVELENSIGFDAEDTVITQARISELKRMLGDKP